MRKRFYKRGKVTSSLNNKMNDDSRKYDQAISLYNQRGIGGVFW